MGADWGRGAAVVGSGGGARAPLVGGVGVVGGRARGGGVGGGGGGGVGGCVARRGVGVRGGGRLGWGGVGGGTVSRAGRRAGLSARFPSIGGAKEAESWRCGRGPRADGSCAYCRGALLLRNPHRRRRWLHRATFLSLVRKDGSLRGGESLGGLAAPGGFAQPGRPRDRATPGPVRRCREREGPGGGTGRRGRGAATFRAGTSCGRVLHGERIGRLPGSVRLHVVSSATLGRALGRSDSAAERFVAGTEGDVRGRLPRRRGDVLGAERLDPGRRSRFPGPERWPAGPGGREASAERRVPETHW